jgi:hypothetical protein
MTNAGQVTKTLKGAGFTKAEWRKVGVSTLNEGFLTSNHFSGSAVITWELAGHYSHPTSAELATINTALVEMAKTLSNAGYSVSLRGDLLKHLEVKK